MTEREVLRRMKEVLVQRGWHRGNFAANDDGSGPVCLLGAEACVLYGDPYGVDVPGLPVSGWTRHLEDQPVGQILRALLPRAVAGWNDYVAKSVDDVIALLDRALASLPEDVGVALAGEEEALAVPAPDALGGSSATPAPKVLA